MWHEARKQEKKIRQNLIDFRKRAERRQDYYEQIVSPKNQVMLKIIYKKKQIPESGPNTIHSNLWKKM